MGRKAEKNRQGRQTETRQTIAIEYDLRVVQAQYSVWAKTGDVPSPQFAIDMKNLQEFLDYSSGKPKDD